MNKITTIALVLAVVFGCLSGYVWIVEAESVSDFEGVKSGFKLVINYQDGNSTVFDHAQFSLLPYRISDSSGKDIESVDIHLLSALRTSGTVGSWSVSGTQQVELYKTPETAPKTSSTIDIKESGSSWNNGVVKELSYVSLHWSQIEGAVQQYGAGDWSLQVNAQLQVKVSFSDGSTDIAGASAPAVALAFTYSDTSTITNWRLTISNDIKTLSWIGYVAAATGIPTWTFHMLFPILTAVCVAIALLTYREN